MMPIKMKIQLIQLSSPQEDWPYPTIPLGLMYIASFLKKKHAQSVDVRLLDLGVEPIRSRWKEKIKESLLEFMPDLVGIRGLTCQESEFFSTAKIIKDLNPRCLVIAGGPHPNAEPEELLRDGTIDWVGLGEGEETMAEIVGKILDNKDFKDTRGIVYREKGEYRYTEPRDPIQSLDSLPFPDYSLLDLAHYQSMTTMTTFFAKSRYTTLFSSRGCPHRCIYCHNIFGKKIRLRSARNIFDEMVHLHHHHDVSEFHIVDDFFNFDAGRTLETFKLIAKSKYRFHLAFPNGLRGDMMDREIIKWAKAAGTYHIAYAAESASPRIQRLIKKYLNLEKLRKTMEWTVEEGIFTSTFNMLGFPTETEEEMLQSINFALASPVHMAIFFLVTPFEGTELYDLAKKHGFKPANGRMRLSYHHIVDDSVPWFTLVPRQRIRKFLYEFNLKFYFEPRRLLSMMKLAPEAHGWDQIGQFLFNRMTELNLTIDALPDQKTRELLWRIMAKAKETAPESCARLPVRRFDSAFSHLKHALALKISLF